MGGQESESKLGMAIQRVADQVCTRVFDPVESFATAPLSFAETLRERHPKIATAITVSALVLPVLLGVGYGLASHELLSGLSAGSDAWIVECAVIKLISRFHPVVA